MNMNGELCEKLSINISAFNGNTTNFNRCPKPNSKALPVQPRQEVPTLPFSKLSVGSVRPL